MRNPFIPVLVHVVAAVVAVAACAQRSDPPAAAPVPVDRPSVRPAVASPTGIAAGDLDRAVDPCTDFYAYATGAWRAAHPIPDGQPRWSRRAVARDANRQQVRDLLAELAAKADWPASSSEQLAGDLFASCMDEAAVDAAGLAPVQPLLAEIDAVRNPRDLQRVIRRLHELQIAAPFGMTGSVDNADPTHYLENVVAGGLGLPDRDAYLATDAHAVAIQVAYRVYIAKLLVLAGMGAGAARTTAGAIFTLEKHLAAASLDSKSAADPALTEHLMSVPQLAVLAPRIDWAGYVEDAKLAHVDLNVTDPTFVARLNQELAETPLATWKAYFRWHVLDDAAPWLTDAFAAASFTFRDQQLAGATEMKPRAARCADVTETLLPEAVGRQYVARHFSPAAKAKAKAITGALLAAIEQNMATVTWMEPATKQLALAKLAASRVEIGYPDHWQSYAGVTIRRDALWANVVQARRFAVDDDRRQVGKPTDRGSWRLPPSSPLAYIDLQINELVLPAGFLQAPVFDPAASDAVNFGALGSGLAHDLMHAIDATGSVLAIDGKPTKWWTANDAVGFEHRAACVRDQYEAYEIEPGIHHKGALVLDEAIGDLGGLHLALAALERSMQTHPVPVLDGFTAEQQFFLAWGQLRGEAMRPEVQRAMVKSDIHPVPRFRVNGPLENLPEFHRAFACKAGAALVRPPERRCAVW
jgi:endothelin-converting enzyme/putative endopeptidase